MCFINKNKLVYGHHCSRVSHYLLGGERESKRWERVDKSENVAFSKEKWRVYMCFISRGRKVCVLGVGECGGGLVRMAV